METLDVRYGSLEWIGIMDAIRYTKSNDVTRTGTSTPLYISCK